MHTKEQLEAWYKNGDITAQDYVWSTLFANDTILYVLIACAALLAVNIFMKWLKREKQQ